MIYNLSPKIPFLMPNEVILIFFLRCWTFPSLLRGFQGKMVCHEPPPENFRALLSCLNISHRHFSKKRSLTAISSTRNRFDDKILPSFRELRRGIASDLRCFGSIRESLKGALKWGLKVTCDLSLIVHNCSQLSSFCDEDSLYKRGPNRPETRG